jgi:hypothetical protein
MRRYCTSSPVLIALACTDYDLQAKQDPAKPDEDTALDSAAPDTALGDTALGESADDSGGGTIIDTSDPEVATEPVYLNTGSALYGYDPTANSASLVGNFTLGGARVTDMTDIAIDLSGHMYGVAYDELYRITPTSAELRHVATLDDEYNALTFVSDGTLVAAGDSHVVTVDTSSGRTSRLGGGGYSSSGDIVGLPDGYLYWSTSGTGDDDLVQVDPSNGQCTKLGSIGASGVFALGYAYGQLYGFTSGSKVLLIDSTTGRATSSDRLTGSWWGATTNPVLW